MKGSRRRLWENAGEALNWSWGQGVKKGLWYLKVISPSCLSPHLPHHWDRTCDMCTRDIHPIKGKRSRAWRRHHFSFMLLGAVEMGKRTGLNLHLSRKVFIKGLKITSPSFRSASHWEAGSGHGKGEGAARALLWQKPLLLPQKWIPRQHLASTWAPLSPGSTFPRQQSPR